MIKIAIVEDEELYAKQLNEYLRQYERRMAKQSRSLSIRMVTGLWINISRSTTSY